MAMSWCIYIYAKQCEFMPKKKSTKRLKRPTSLIIQGQARSSVLKTQNNKLGKLKRIYQYLWTDFLSFPSPVSCCSYPLGVHSDGHIWSSRYDFCSGKLCLISIKSPIMRPGLYFQTVFCETYVIGLIPGRFILKLTCVDR